MGIKWHNSILTSYQSAIVGLSPIIFLYLLYDEECTCRSISCLLDDEDCHNLEYLGYRTFTVVENSNFTSVFGLGLENLVSASVLASSFWPQLKHLASFTISDKNDLIHKCTNYLLNITQQSDEQRECR